MSSSVVRVEGVTKRFAGHTAVHDLTMEVPAGGIFGLLGPNGAGKSTTIRMMLNILTPDEGRITLFGGEAARGALPEERGLYKKMRVGDHLTFLGEAKGIARSAARQKAGEWLERLGIADWTMKRVEDLSKGMQ